MIPKYCVGFLFVILVPVIALILEGDIRNGVRSERGWGAIRLPKWDQ